MIDLFVNGKSGIFMFIKYFLSIYVKNIYIYYKMNEESMLYCLIAFILGYLVSRHMANRNGFRVGLRRRKQQEQKQPLKVSADLALSNGVAYCYRYDQPTNTLKPTGKTC